MSFLRIIRWPHAKAKAFSVRSGCTHYFFYSHPIVPAATFTSWSKDIYFKVVSFFGLSFHFFSKFIDQLKIGRDRSSIPFPSINALQPFLNHYKIFFCIAFVVPFHGTDRVNRFSGFLFRDDIGNFFLHLRKCKKIMPSSSILHCIHDILRHNYWQLYFMVRNMKTKKRNPRKKNVKKSPRKWSARVMQKSDALDLDSDIFKSRDPNKVARSLKRSAEKSRRKKGTAFQSAMSMLNFYINRAGKTLSTRQKVYSKRRRKGCAKFFTGR